MIQLIKKLSVFFLCLMLLTGGFPTSVMAAPEWPANVAAQAEGAIVIDANTGTVLWGQNIHSQYFPASITKIMTALLVIENCNMDEMVTFSHNAVFNVESGSSNAGIAEGDKLSVKDCLYALVLKSANEAGNALAEHVAGTTEKFAEMMTAKAVELGCTDTHFANPSGLNDPEHYTSPYDMALIAKAAYNNPTFSEINSTTHYKLPPNSINPEGLSIYPGHKMLKKNTPYYYPGVIGGKTGYTTLAGNTLVTCAERDGMLLIAVILKGSTPQYWTDTKNLLDFGFENFTSVNIADYETAYNSVPDDLSFNGLSIDKPAALILDSSSRITLPKTAEFTDAVSELSYDINSADPKKAIAKICYRYNDRVVGCTYLEINDALFDAANASTVETTVSPEASETTVSSSVSETTVSSSISETTVSPSISETTAAPVPSKPFKLPAISGKVLMNALLVIVLSAVLGAITAFIISKKNKAKRESNLRRERRLKRLQDSGFSADEFNSLLEQRRSSYSSKRNRRRRKRR